MVCTTGFNGVGYSAAWMLTAEHCDYMENGEGHEGRPDLRVCLNQTLLSLGGTCRSSGTGWANNKKTYDVDAWANRLTDPNSNLNYYVGLNVPVTYRDQYSDYLAGSTTVCASLGRSDMDDCGTVRGWDLNLNGLTDQITVEGIGNPMPRSGDSGAGAFRVGDGNLAATGIINANYDFGAEKGSLISAIRAAEGNTGVQVRTK
jgi:hypothetical protein